MKLWAKGISTDAMTEQFTVGSDRELDVLLAPYDIQGTLAHTTMLHSIGLLSESEYIQIKAALAHLDKEVALPSFTISKEFEDIHSWLEYHITQRCGDAGKKVHTARSRNDQVLTAIQLYIKDQAKQLYQEVSECFTVLMEKAEAHTKDLLPGFTHLQIAMPSSFGLWFSAYAESLIDDLYQLEAALKIADQNPLGSAAGYGSSFPIDREETTKLLGFNKMKVNVVAAQMARGKVERSLAFALSSLGSTLSRMAMDICLYMSQPLQYLSFPDTLTTGSSIMPHKKNPDIFELIRGKCNRLQAVPNELSLLMTNLPSGYHREYQLTKAILFPALEEMHACLSMMTYALKEIEVKKELLEDPSYDLLFTVETLNREVENGKPFRDAYKDLALSIQNGTYKANKDLHHTHIGSLGNPGYDRIREKMKQVSATFR